MSSKVSGLAIGIKQIKIVHTKLLCCFITTVVASNVVGNRFWFWRFNLFLICQRNARPAHRHRGASSQQQTAPHHAGLQVCGGTAGEAGGTRQEHRHH